MNRDTHSDVHPTAGPVDHIWHDERSYLLGIAYRILGNRADAEDVVQEAFQRLIRARLDEIRDTRGWLTVTVRRLCLNRLQSAYARRETTAGTPPEPTNVSAALPDPSDRVTLDDEVQLALTLVLDQLTPAERTLFVLHDVFGLSFDEIAEVVGRTPAACRQLASRGRRSIRSSARDPRPVRRTRHDRERIVVERFIAACASGDVSELLEVLDPDVVGHATFVGGEQLAHVESALEVAGTAIRILGSSSTRLVPTAVEERAGIVAITGGHVRAVMQLETRNDRITSIRAHVIAPARPRS